MASFIHISGVQLENRKLMWQSRISLSTVNLRLPRWFQQSYQRPYCHL